VKRDPKPNAVGTPRAGKTCRPGPATTSFQSSCLPHMLPYIAGKLLPIAGNGFQFVSNVRKFAVIRFRITDFRFEVIWQRYEVQYFRFNCKRRLLNGQKGRKIFFAPTAFELIMVRNIRQHGVWSWKKARKSKRSCTRGAATKRNIGIECALSAGLAAMTLPESASVILPVLTGFSNRIHATIFSF